MRYLSIAIIASLLRGVSTDVTCTAGTFSMGTKGFVRCDLGKDVRTGKYQFSVVHCEEALCDAHTKTYPLVCNIDDGNLQCDADLVPGYSFDRLVDSSLTLIVTTVNRNTTGLYYCQVMSDGSPRHTCNLSPTGPPAVTARTSMSQTSTTKNRENQAHTESERTADLQGSPVKFVVVLAVLLAVLVVCGLLIAFIVFIRYKNSRRQDAAERQEDIETGSSRCERFAIICKLLAPPPNPKVDASEGTNIVMNDKEVQVQVQVTDKDGKQKPKGLKKRFGLGKSTENLTFDTDEEGQLKNKDGKIEEPECRLPEKNQEVEVPDARPNPRGGGLRKMFGLGKSTENLTSDTGEGHLKNKDDKPEKNQDDKVAEFELPPENQDDKMAESKHLLLEENSTVDEADEGVVCSEKHTGASAKPDKDVKKKKSSGGSLFSKLRSNKRKKSSDNPDNTDTGEERELTNMVEIKTEESKLLPEKTQDEKKLEAELLLKESQDDKMTESVSLLGEEIPTVEADGAVKSTDAIPEADKDAKLKPEKTPSKWSFGKHSKGSKAQKK